MYVSFVGKMFMSSTNKLSYNYFNGLYVSYLIDGETINVIALYFTLELVQRLLVNLHTTLLSLLIYYMSHHHYVLGDKLTNTYLTTVGDALTGKTSLQHNKCNHLQYYFYITTLYY